MKHHCEGYSGWWRGECPQPMIELAPGQLFTADQQTLFIGVFLAFLLIAAIVMLVIATATVTDS